MRNTNLTIFSTLFLLISCGGGPSSAALSSPDTTVRTFLSYSAGNDLSGVKGCIVAAERDKLQLKLDPGKSQDGYKITKTDTAGDRSKVTVQFDRGETQTLYLRREGGSWYLSFLETMFAQKGFSDEAMGKRLQAMTSNVGQAVQDLGEGASQEEIAEAMQQAMQESMRAASPDR